MTKTETKNTYTTRKEAERQARTCGGHVHQVLCPESGGLAEPDEYGDAVCQCGRYLKVRGRRLPRHAPNQIGSLGYTVEH
jgi:hypothetical protein